MDDIARANRRESWLERPATRAEAILAVLRASPAPLTARQIVYKMGLSDMNSVRPRLTELWNAGKVRIVGKAKDGMTGKSTSLYEAVER